MSINRRVTGGGKLAHHRLFGSLETPPLGWIGGNDFSFSLDDYEAEVAALIKKGKRPTEAHREVGRTNGPLAWKLQQIEERDGTRHMVFRCGAFYMPPHSGIHPPMSADREFTFHEHNRIIAGWWYDRHLGLGPTSTIAAWVATKVGYISEGQPKLNLHHGKTDIIYCEPPRCVGINPYRDFEYIGEFKRAILPHPDYLREAETAVREWFARIHGAKK
jgi:hypothetical protein